MNDCKTVIEVWCWKSGESVTIKEGRGVVFFFFKILFIFRERRKGKEKERERNINMWLPLAGSLRGTWPTTQPCALTGNRTGDPMVCRPALNPLSHISQGT